MKNLVSFRTTKAALTGLCLITSAVAVAQDVQLDWARQLGSAARFISNSIATDASGNVYTTGYFRGTADFNPGEGVFNLTSADENEYVHDIFISKLDAGGNFVWAKRMGGTDNDEGNSITVDASGNVYTTGHFRGTVDFDPGDGVFNLTSASTYQSDAFISKLDAQGNFVWARRLGGDGYDVGTSIAADASGNVYTTGYFMGTSDFDPGEGVFNLTSSSSDIFISKLNAEGNFVWARRLGGANDDHGHSIAVDASGNVYTTGYFTGTADFNPGEEVFNLSIPRNNSTGIFISKLDAGGGFVWAKQMGSVDETKISENMGHSIAVDASGHIYTTGHFSNTCDFNPGEGIFNLTSAGWRDVFISKLDLGGNFIWAKQLGTSYFDEYGYSIAVDASGLVYITGSYLGKLDSEGNFIWTDRNTTGGRYSLAVDASRHVYATGPLLGTVDLDPGEGVFNLTNASEYAEIFIVKLSPVAVVNAHFDDDLGWCGNCEREILKITDANGKNQYMAYVFGDASTPGAEKFTVYWDGSQWRGQYAEKSSATGGSWVANSTFAANGLTTSPKPPCTGWSQGFSLSGDCITPSVTVQSPSGAPSINASAAKTTGLVNSKNAYEIPVTGGAEKVIIQWNALNSRWEMIWVTPGARMAAETVLSTNTGNAGTNPPCGGWSNGYGLSGDICTSNGSLPVTLLSFSASLTDSKSEVRLNWSTTSEDNAWYYALERSRDAKLFEEIARISAGGNTQETTHYIHTDETPLRGRSYYRLRQVDRDDSFTYSSIISVLTTAADAPYPNPARGGIFRIEAARGAALKLTDLSGRDIPFTIQRIDEELMEIRPAQKLQPGVYVVSIDRTGYRVVVDP